MPSTLKLNLSSVPKIAHATPSDNTGLNTNTSPTKMELRPKKSQIHLMNQICNSTTTMLTKEASKIALKSQVNNTTWPWWTGLWEMPPTRPSSALMLWELLNTTSNALVCASHHCSTPSQTSLKASHSKTAVSPLRTGLLMSNHKLLASSGPSSQSLFWPLDILPVCGGKITITSNHHYSESDYLLQFIDI